MTADSVLSLFAGGGVLGIIGALAVVLIRQVAAGGRLTEEQAAGWRSLVETSQGDAAIARAAIAGLTVELEKSNDENEELRRDIESLRRRLAQYERGGDA